MSEVEKRAANFIEEFVEEGHRQRSLRPRPHPVPPGTQRLFAYRPRQGPLHRLSASPEKYGGKCNLRFDDTNPTKEDAVFVDNIQKDISWLGFQWDELHFASDFFDQSV